MGNKPQGQDVPESVWGKLFFEDSYVAIKCTAVAMGQHRTHEHLSAASPNTNSH
jgi:hypothetical protein